MSANAVQRESVMKSPTSRMLVGSSPVSSSGHEGTAEDHGVDGLPALPRPVHVLEVED